MSRPIERKNQQKNGMMIGRHTDDQYAFMGKISSVAFFRDSFDQAQIQVGRRKRWVPSHWHGGLDGGLMLLMQLLGRGY